VLQTIVKLRYDAQTNLMRRAILILTVAVSSSLVVLHAADDLVLARFGEYLDALRTQAGIPTLAAAIVGPGEVQWERAFGRQNVERAIDARPDTPFHLDALTQVFTASIILRCVEEGRVSLDARIGSYSAEAPEPNATVRQLLTHTTGSAGGLAFAYRPERLAGLAFAASACSGNSPIAAVSYRSILAARLDSLGMQLDSVPGPDVMQLAPQPFPAATLDRYRGALARLATPYAVDAQGRASPSRYVSPTLTPAAGLISSVQDLEKFDLALKRGVLLRPETIAAAWTPPLGAQGRVLPHGLGWFVQSYAGEPVVWQFGVGDNASSSLIVTLPRRGLTLILLANSDGLSKPFALAAGDLSVSTFGRLFLGIFVR